MRRWTQRQGECEQALGSKKHALVKKTPIQTTKLKPDTTVKGWQTRRNAALRQFMTEHPLSQ